MEAEIELGLCDGQVDTAAEAIDLTGSPISVHSSLGHDDDDEDEDEFEEVEIPVAAGSASMPGTPTSGTPADVGTSAAAGDGGGGYSDSDSEEDANQVIRLEIGGETEEQKAKRIALAMRK